MLIYNSLTGAFAVLEKHTVDTYLSIENLTEETISNFDTTYVDLMKSNGFIIDSNINEFNKFNVISNLSKYSSKTLNLTITPTTFCNMKCTYCFENVEKRKMTDTVISGIISFVKAQVDEKK